MLKYTWDEADLVWSVPHIADFLEEVVARTGTGKVDLDRVALMGHSRGGEAVAHAAAFNRLRYYPDDTSLEFDFNFGVRAVVAIAPVDGQYLPTDRPVRRHG